jgi:hypothetical protein
MMLPTAMLSSLSRYWRLTWIGNAERGDAQVDEIFRLLGEIPDRDAVERRLADAGHQLIPIHAAMRTQRDHDRNVAVGRSGGIEFVQEDGQDQSLRSAARAVIDQNESLLPVPDYQLTERRRADWISYGRSDSLS